MKKQFDQKTYCVPKIIKCMPFSQGHRISKEFLKNGRPRIQDTNFMIVYAYGMLASVTELVQTYLARFCFLIQNGGPFPSQKTGQPSKYVYFYDLT